MAGLALGICLLAFVTTYWAGRRSLPFGLCAVVFWGYFYGILRANIINAFSHFIFDASLAGCYLSLLWQKVPANVRVRSAPLGDWVSVLVAWTLLIGLIPFQTPMVTLVGLRGNLFFVPILLLAARITEVQLRGLITFLGVMNIVALGFGVAEYFQGIERFYPVSEVTAIIYRSHDVAGGHYRIPAIFNNAHGYAGSMVATMPFLLALTGLSHASYWQRIVAVLGLVAAMFGVLFASTRTNFIAASVILLAFLFVGKIRPLLKGALLVIVFAVGVVALSNERFQRFRSLEDTDAVTGRLAGSVNRSFLEVLTDYPFGNGLGGGGTSVPHFLVHEVRHAVSVENEYARIALELGMPGLVLWLSFLGWILLRGSELNRNDPWIGGRRLVWVYLLINFGLSLLGTGMLTAIPATILALFSAGWLITKPNLDEFPVPDGSPPSTIEVESAQAVVPFSS